MKFEVGDLVWCGWAPDHDFWKDDPLAKDARLKQGTILGFIGVFFCHGVGLCNYWDVDVEGNTIESEEPYLTRIPPGGEFDGRETEKPHKEPAEAV